MPHRQNYSFTALTLLLIKSGAEIQLLPSGDFRARDGRPDQIKNWRIDAAIAAKLVARAAARQTPFVIDYEHQTLLSEKNGQPAPAAGWFKTLVWREGQGLFATDVEWTENATAYIASGEYKFISPVFAYDKTGAVIELMNAGLTNNPAIDGMLEVAQRAAAKFSETQTEQECDPMSEFLKNLLGLNADADDTAIEGAVTALKAAADKTTTLETEVAALKSAAPDPAKYVPADTVKDLQGQVATLTARIHGTELDGMINAGLSDGRILPAMETWARELGKKDLAQLKSYLDNASPVAALNNTQTGGKSPADDSGNTADDIAAAALKYQNEQAAAGTQISTVQAVEHVMKGK